MPSVDMITCNPGGRPADKTLQCKGDRIGAEEGRMDFWLKVSHNVRPFFNFSGFGFINTKVLSGWTEPSDLSQSHRSWILVTGSSSNNGWGHTVNQNTCKIECHTSKEVFQN